MKSFIALCVVAVVMAAQVRLAHALTSNWVNAAGGDWGSAANWDNGVPGAADTANIALSGTYTVTSSATRNLEVLILGGSSGTQTLAITAPLTVSSSVVSVQIGTHGVLDISATYLWFTGRYDSVGLDNYGTVRLHNDGTIYGDSAYIRNQSSALLHGYLCPHMQNLYNSWLVNYGTVDIEGGCGASITMVFVNQSSGAFTVDDSLWCEYILNYGAAELEYGALLMSKPIAIDWPSRIWNWGTWTMRGNSRIMAHPGWPDLPPLVGNFGLWQVAADTSLAGDDASILAHFAQLGDTADLHVNSGNLWLPGANDTVALAADTLTDSVYVAAGCTLHVAHALFDDSVIVSGSGTIHFFDGATSARGAWPFSGGFYLTTLPSDTTVVSFDPRPPPSVVLSSLNMGMPNTGLLISNSDTLTVGGLRQDGGTVSGNVVVTDTYDWTRGTFTADTSADITIPPGVTLNVTTGGAKVLDSLSLNIEGSATMQDSGVFTLLDSAVVNIAPLGTLDVFGGFSMVGIGTFYNSGQTTFDPQGDTIRILVPVVNSTASRTPGTIDVLSAPVVFGSNSSNSANLIVHDGGQLILDGTFTNIGGSLQIWSGGELSVTDTLLNIQPGILDFQGGSNITGNGRIINRGLLTKSGSMMLTPTNVDVQPVLENAVDSGHVVIAADTLTLLSGGTNRGTITIQAGTVLRVFGNFLNDSSGVIIGSGVLDVSGATFTNLGTILPGSSPGTLAINGGMVCGASALLSLELAGPAANQQDHLVISGHVVLAGRLHLTVSNGYVPAPSDSLSLLTCASWSGAFAEITGGGVGGGTYLDITMDASGMRVYVCHSGTTYSSAITALQDTVHVLDAREDTLYFQFSNTGSCPLEYALSLSNLNPPTPAWIEVLSGDESGVLRHDVVKDVRLPVAAAGLGAGNQTAVLTVSTNDPAQATVQIPITLFIEPLPPVVDLTVRRAATYIQLNWSAVSGAAQYRVYRSTSWPVQPESGNLMGTVTSTSVQDSGAFGARFYYVVTAVR